MPGPAPIPLALAHGPFSVHDARQAGVSTKMLRGRRFTQLVRGVYVLSDHQMTQRDWIAAAKIAMPERAQVSHLTRIQDLGLDFGPTDPLHFSIRGDHHLAMNGVFLHRTDRLPPTDDDGVTPTAAFIGVCSWERKIDSIKIGDWLLHNGHMSIQGLTELARFERWRVGAREALKIARWLDGGVLSLPESELRVLLEASGLPRPQVNAPLFDDPNSPVGDLWIPQWRTCIEYEGGHHFTDRDQILRDEWRYARMRADGIEYVRVLSEMMRSPRAVVGQVHDALRRQGYDGPAPEFGHTWASLFRPMRQRPSHRQAS